MKDEKTGLVCANVFGLCWSRDLLDEELASREVSHSATVADIKAIGRAFRDKAGNFLFVVTADYDDLEFVLLDRLGNLHDS